MAPRANWKGFLRLSLVTCPVALYPATSDSEKISFNQINKNTGHRIKYSRVDSETGEEVPSEDIVKAFKVDTDTYVEVSKEELENVALESTRTIEIDEFVPRSDIDPRYIIRPYYLRPDGKVGHDAFAVIRETIRSMDKVAIGRLVLTSREHIIALDALDKGLMGTLLRYPYEVRSEEEYFDEIQDVKVTKDMLELAKHIVIQKAGYFEPDKFKDQYETALVVEQWPSQDGHYPVAAYQAAFGLSLALQAATLTWFAVPWLRSFVRQLYLLFTPRHAGPDDQLALVATASKGAVLEARERLEW
jgi:DNA end-binding protein Ku